jgi:hypothetical protein
LGFLLSARKKSFHKEALRAYIEAFDIDDALARAKSSITYGADNKKARVKQHLITALPNGHL